MSSTTSNNHSQLVDSLQSLDVLGLSDTERNDLVVNLRNALQKVESPWQRMQSLVWENSGHAAALKIAHDVGLFKSWNANSEEILDVEKAAKITNACHVDLLDRVLRALAYKGTLELRGLNQYGLSPFAKSLGDPAMAACLDYWFDFQIPALTNLPAYLQSTSYRLPKDPMSTAWNYATKDPTPFFGWLEQRPEKMAVFAQTMQRYSASQPSWVDLYPAGDLLKDWDKSTPLIVDVGGSQGHDLRKFIERHQPLSGSCYLQDRPEVLESAAVPEGVRSKAMDFFRDEPVKDARAYYLHSVLHDWSDEQCRQILTNIKSAMDVTNSRILIHELVRMEDGSGDLVSLGEFTVMAILGAPERSEKQWRSLVESVGLEVKNVYSHPLSVHSILEIEAQ